ncbi:hypothetical protein BC826DRAFT_1006385 [Russula brevipes]|nr:hypothetical protein BC826DRAFT_1006385 [Russula brevipes]
MSTPSSGTPQPTASQQPQSAAATPQFVAYPLAPGQQPQLPPQAGSSEVRTQPQTRLPSAETRQDRSLVDFLLMLDDYEPLIPDEVTDYYLQRVGFDCQDARLKRLLRWRHKSSSPTSLRMPINMRGLELTLRWAYACKSRPRASRDKTRTTLTMEDLGAALSEYGINSRKPEFYL